MTVEIDAEELDHIANLAKLAPNRTEKQVLSAQLNDIVKFFHQLNELDTSNIEPLQHVHDLGSVFRCDEPKPSLQLEKIIRNSPGHHGDFFCVPKVIK